jgi:hypothetical protein
LLHCYVLLGVALSQALRARPTIAPSLRDISKIEAVANGWKDDEGRRKRRNQTEECKRREFRVYRQETTEDEGRGRFGFRQKVSA